MDVRVRRNRWLAAAALAMLPTLTACSASTSVVAKAPAAPTTHAEARARVSSPPPASGLSPAPEPEPTVGEGIDLRRYLLAIPPGSREMAGDSGADHWLTIREIARRDSKSAERAEEDEAYLRNLGLSGAAVINWADYRHRAFVTVEIERFPSPALALLYRGEQTDLLIKHGRQEPGLLLPPHTIIYVDAHADAEGARTARAEVNDHNLYVAVFVTHIGKTLSRLARSVSQQQVRRLRAAFGTAA